MVIYGDSHAAMWFRALNSIALRAHWRLIELGKGDCPADSLSYTNPPGWGNPHGEYAACDQWHRFAIDRINRLRPDLVIITQEYRRTVNGSNYTPQQWQGGLEATLDQLQIPKANIVILGNIPLLPQSAPQCLAHSSSDIQSCSGSKNTVQTKYNQAEIDAAHREHVRYVNVMPWFCSTVCTPVIGRYEVYWDQYHVDGTYSIVLERVLQQALRLPADS